MLGADVPPDATYEEILASVAESLRDQELPQNPQITGEGGKVLFVPSGSR